ncbi:hypothetical protein M752DRAFT_22132 [Aspergillus phoenicis ATCC 13157]|uniref:Uncharacterized protein n=1 Tax=Aspergillus phoenicis ATCC 13157 TaxID=1353007 RepID=A0A370PJ82_ASPPH|nr:hypothetical protein M752DRAFT_22132 [Aspergillus phoenicis ATCC 13157]
MRLPWYVASSVMGLSVPVHIVLTRNKASEGGDGDRGFEVEGEEDMLCERMLRCYLIQVGIGDFLLLVRKLQMVDGYVAQCQSKLIPSIDELTDHLFTGCHRSALVIPTSVDQSEGMGPNTATARIKPAWSRVAA